MAEAPKLRYEVIADDKTAKGINSAKKNVSALEKSIKNLASAFGVAFTSQKVVQFLNQSTKAFLADEAAATKLGNAVKNLGYGFAQGYVNDYIKGLETATKVADDELRPAFQTLIQQTGSLTQAQSILNTAIETSRGSGEALSTVANDLAQAYVGNTKGLKKYYLGLDAATLKTKSFVEIQQMLNKQFSGANEAYLNTYAGQVGALGLAWQNFQEQAGGALLMLASLGEGSNAQGLNNVAKALDVMGKAVNTIAKGATSVLALFNVFGKNKGFLGLFDPTGASNPLQGVVKADKNSPADFLSKYKKMLADIAAQNKKQSAAQLAAQKKLTAEQKKQDLLKKQGSIFDLDQIQLIAALKGKLSDEDRKRAELQLALLQGDEETAKRLTTEIANAIDKTGKLSQYLNSLTANNDPFKAWLESLERVAARAGQIVGGVGTAPLAGNTQIMPQTNAVDYSGFALDLAGAGSAGSASQFGGSTPWAQAAQNSQVVVQIDGKTIASALMDQSLSGNQVYVDRRTGGFNF